MRVIDAEKLDEYLTDIVRDVTQARNLALRRGHGDRAAYYLTLANNIRAIANHVANMSQEGTLYLTPPQQSSDMSGAPVKRNPRTLYPISREPAFPPPGD